MKKILPINTDPYIRTYTHHGFFHSILSTDEKICMNEDDTVAEIFVKDFEKQNWEMQSDQLEYRKDPANHLLFTTNKWNYGMNMAFWKDCVKNSELSLTIYKQLYSNAWSSITLFITNKNHKDMTNLNSYDIAFGNFEKDGVFYSTQKDVHNRIISGLQKPLTLVLIKDDQNIYYQYKNDTFCSNRIFIKKLEEDDTSYRIGFAINLGNSIYYEWLFSNYINMNFKPNEYILLDYMFNLHKNWCQHTANHLVDYNRFTQRELKSIHFTPLEYIKLQIDLDYYVELEINDNLHINRSDKNGQLFHQNLIYGYDDDLQCIYTLYTKFGKLESAKMSYQDFESERNQRESNILYMLKYNPCYEPYFLSPKRLLQLYKEYRDEDNISFYEPQYEKDSVLGLGCFRLFCTNEGIKYVLSDVRVSHLLYERATCNLDRIKYLLFLNIITDEDFKSMSEMIQEQITTLLIVRNRVVKSIIGGKLIESKIHQLMLKASQIEECFTNKIIGLLDQNS